jgi:hypothetical protein
VGKGDNSECVVSSPREKKPCRPLVAPLLQCRHDGGSARETEAFGDLDLLAAVVKRERTFYESTWAKYPLAVPAILTLG